MSNITTYSRDFLKSMPEQRKQEQIDRLVGRIMKEIFPLASTGKTTYLYVKNNDRQMSNEPLLTDAEIIAGFFTRFPGCKIYYDESWVETNSSTRTLKKGIMIDWS
jgi:hypothetical protein